MYKKKTQKGSQDINIEVNKEDSSSNWKTSWKMGGGKRPETPETRRMQAPGERICNQV